MTSLRELFQTADWKSEKHVPVIEAPETVKKGEPFTITVSVGKEIPHPNTTEHHIRWITVMFLPSGEKFPYQIGRFEFTAHGESTKGPDTSSVYTQPEVVVKLKTDKGGTIYSSSYCNIHGLWQHSNDIAAR
ncbi:MAG: class II SORL domain-containing protein [bacterium]